MELELILFKACPFAQRTVITLDYLGTAHKKTLINPMDKPSWLMQIAPLGQIPLLRVDGGTVLFDSVAICEYLNDMAGGRLLPEEPLKRASYRGLIEFAGNCQMNFGAMIAAANEEKFDQARQDFLKKLVWLEGQVDASGPLFGGGDFSLVDAAYAPLFMRMKHLQLMVPFYQPATLPRLGRWSESLLDLAVVVNSVDGDFSKIFRMIVQSRGKGGYVDTRVSGH